MTGITEEMVIQTRDFVQSLGNRSAREIVTHSHLFQRVTFMGKEYRIFHYGNVTDTKTYNDGSSSWSHAQVKMHLDTETDAFRVEVVNFPWEVAVEIIGFLEGKRRDYGWRITEIRFIPKTDVHVQKED